MARSFPAACCDEPHRSSQNRRILRALLATRVAQGSTFSLFLRMQFPRSSRYVNSNGGRSFSVRNRLMGAIVAGAAALFLLPAIFAQTAKQSKTAGTPPDLTGVWLIDHFQGNLFPKGDAPFTPWGEAQFKLADTK